jgi:YVTN family beta-propeller protein
MHVSAFDCLKWGLPLVILALVFASLPDAAASTSSVSKQASAAIAITSDGATLLVVNPDSNSLTLVDAATRLVHAEVAVGVDPRAVAVSPDDATAYVANQGSNTLSIVDLAAQSVVSSEPVGDRPVGVAVSPDGRFVVVAELGDDRVRFFSAASLRPLAAVPVADRPHGLAFTPDGSRLLVTHLLGGDVTVIPVRPYISYLPLVHRSADTLCEARRVSRVSRSAFAVSSIATWPNVAPAPAVLVNAAGTRAYLPQTMANGQGLNTRFDTSVFPKVSVLNLATNSHQTSEHIPLPERDQPVGLPWDVALARDDTELWVVNAASNDVSVLDISDPSRPSRVAHVTVGDNPRGIVISPDGGAAYVNNVLAGTVSVIDAGTYAVVDVITVTDIPLPPTLLHGKRLFHSSARSDLARAAWISCNTCHVEAEHDGRTWQLQFVGEAPPGSVVVRNTTGLLGMIETYPLRWSAEWDESADSEFSIRFEQYGSGLIDGSMHPTLGVPNQGRSYDLDCLAAFIDSLAVPARTCNLTAAGQRGRAVFESAEAGCATCHPAPLYTDLQVHDVGTADGDGEWFGPYIDTPTLRFLYDTAPYLHDGSAATLYDVLTMANPDDEHGATSQLSEDQVADLVAFLLALPCDE